MSRFYSIFKDEVPKYLKAIIGSYIVTCSIYFALNAMLDTNIRNSIKRIENLKYVDKAYNLIKYPKHKKENHQRNFEWIKQVFKGETVLQNLDSIESFDPQKMFYSLIYGVNLNNEKEINTWLDVISLYMFPYLSGENSNINLKHALKLFNFEGDNELIGLYGDKEKYQQIKSIFADAFLSNILDEIKASNSYKLRRYLNGEIQFITFIVAFIGIFMLMSYLTSILKEKRIYLRAVKKLNIDSIGSWNEIKNKYLDLEQKKEFNDHVLVRKLISGIRTFYFRGNEEAVHILNYEIEEVRQDLESRYGMLKYFAWAVPSIGFIGTVIGIGNALGSAHNVIGQGGSFETKGAVQAITGQLGVAFDTTLVALVLSILLVFGIHVMTRIEEGVTASSLDNSKQIISKLSPLEAENKERRFRRLLESLNIWSSDQEILVSPFKDLKSHLENKLNLK